MKNFLSIFQIGFLLFVLYSCKGGGGDGGGETASSSGSSQSQASQTMETEPLFKYSWFIKNQGTKGLFKSAGEAGHDVNYPKDFLRLSSTEKLTGKGVKIAVSDTGVDIHHEDLKDNVIEGSRDYSWSVSRNDWYTGSQMNPAPSYYDGSNHGTAVAGLIAASNNGKGIVGIAPKAGIAGFKYIGFGYTTSEQRVDQASGDFDIFNYSYGGMPCSFHLSYDQDLINQLAYGVKNQRDGKGSLYVKASGNEYKGTLKDCYSDAYYSSIHDEPYYGNSAMEEDQNYPYYILVGALDENGKRGEYSTPGPNLWISAPGGSGQKNGQKMVTTSMRGCGSPDLKEWIDVYKKYDSNLDNYSSYFIWNVKSLKEEILQIITNSGYLNKFDWNNESENKNCNYTASLNGTSFAAPIVSGAIALILEANPDLNWRQVKYILAATAKKIDDDEGKFNKYDWKYINTDEQELDNILKKWDSQKEHPGIKDFESYEDRFTLAANVKYRQGWIRRAHGGDRSDLVPEFYHNWYGFGALDIEKAVNLAKMTKNKGWGSYFNRYQSFPQPGSLEDAPLVQTVNPNTNEWYYEKSFEGVTLKTGDTYGDPTPDASRNSKIETGIPVVHNLYIEAVQVKLSISDDAAENYKIDLCNGINPQKSFCHTLLNPKSGIKGELSNKTFLSNAFYLMKSGGIWHLVVRKVDGTTVGKLENWKINFFGFRSTNPYTSHAWPHRNEIEGFTTTLEKENDNWSINLSWDPPTNSGQTQWINHSRYVYHETNKNLLCLRGWNGSSRSFRARTLGGYRFEISIGSEPKKDDLYKWSFIANNKDYEKFIFDSGFYLCKAPVITLTKDHLKKGGFIPKAGETYHINIRNINLFNDLTLERSVEELSTEWTAPDDL